MQAELLGNLVPQGVYVVKALNTLDLEDLQGERKNLRILLSRKLGQFRLPMFSAKEATTL
jgi:hypothetical protein